MYLRRSWTRRAVVVALVLVGLGIVAPAASAESMPLTTGTISTVAGDGYPQPDNRPAVNANLAHPSSVVTDRNGNVYIADHGHERVRKVDVNGVITTIAGTGKTGYNGDNIPATEAELRRPVALAVDGAGDLYIADKGNHRVRKVRRSDGVITTVAGNGDGQFGNTHYGVPAVNTAVSFPDYLAMDNDGNLLVNSQARIMKVDPSGILHYVVDGSSVAFDKFENRYVARYDGEKFIVVKRSPDGSERTIFSLGQRRLLLTISGTGDLYIMEEWGHINKIDQNGVLTTINDREPGYGGDGGPVGSALFDGISGLSTDAAGNLFIADRNNGRVRKVDTRGIVTTFAGVGRSDYNGDGGRAIFAVVQTPYSTAVDGVGNLYISDSWNNVIRKVATNGVITTFARVPAVGLAIDSAGNIYASDISEPQVRKISPDGVVTRVAGNGSRGYSGDGGAAVNAQLNHPHTIAVDGAGNLYIGDSMNARVRKVSTNGVIATVAGTGVSGFSGDGGAAVNAQVGLSMSVGADRAGSIYIGDMDNYRLRKVDTAGVIRTIAGGDRFGDTGDGGPAVNALLGRIDGMTTDPAGNTYLLIESRVRKVDTNGVINRVAGTGVAGYSGDGGNALQAQLRQPMGMSTDAAGSLYIADTFNNRVRKVTFSG